METLEVEVLKAVDKGAQTGLIQMLAKPQIVGFAISLVTSRMFAAVLRGPSGEWVEKKAIFVQSNPHSSNPISDFIFDFRFEFCMKN